jgi:predicted HicB family RNase H-like nuclease
MMRDHYTYRVTWSPEDKEYVGTCAEFPSLSHLDADPIAAVQGIRALVQDVVADMKSNREAIPEPFAEASYSGKFMVRVPPELHRRLTIEAAEAHVSLNRLASFRLATPAAPRGKTLISGREARRKQAVFTSSNDAGDTTAMEPIRLRAQPTSHRSATRTFGELHATPAQPLPGAAKKKPARTHGRNAHGPT